MKKINATRGVIARSKQRGATMWSTLSIVFMIGFMAMLAFKLIPLYMEHGIIRSSMQEIANQAGFREMSQREIVSALNKRLMIDNIRGFDKEAFKVATDKTGQKFILIDYSQKVSIASNVSALVEFKEEIRPNKNK